MPTTLAASGASAAATIPGPHATSSTASSAPRRAASRSRPIASASFIAAADEKPAAWRVNWSTVVRLWLTAPGSQTYGARATPSARGSTGYIRASAGKPNPRHRSTRKPAASIAASVSRSV